MQELLKDKLNRKFQIAARASTENPIEANIYNELSVYVKANWFSPIRRCSEGGVPSPIQYRRIDRFFRRGSEAGKGAFFSVGQ